MPKGPDKSPGYFGDFNYTPSRDPFSDYQPPPEATGSDTGAGFDLDFPSRTPERRRSTRGRLATALFLGLLTVGGVVATGPKAIEALKKPVHPVKTAEAADKTKEPTAILRPPKLTVTPIPVATELPPVIYGEVTPGASISPENIDNLDYEVATILKYENGIQVEFNKDGLPLRIIKPDGEAVVMDLKYVTSVRQEAMSQQCPQAIDAIRFPLPESTDSVAPSKEHPVVVELPKDVISTEGLADRGVKIIQSNITNLYIRPGAFIDGPFKSFDGSGRKLTIVLVDGPSISPVYLNDPKYDEVIDSLPKSFKLSVLSVKEMRQQLKNRFLSDLNKGQQIFAHIQEEVVKDVILASQSQCYAVDKMDEDEVKDMYAYLFTTRNKYNDTYKSTFGVHSIKGLQDTIFVAVGKAHIHPYVTTYFNEDGFFEIRDLSITPSNLFTTDFTPNQNQNYFDPNQLQRYENTDSTGGYLFKVATPGQILRHEGEHTELDDERATELSMFNSLQRANNRLREYGIDDGYYFVFSLPGGGYILTEKETKPTSDKKF